MTKTAIANVTGDKRLSLATKIKKVPDVPIVLEITEASADNEIVAVNAIKTV